MARDISNCIYSTLRLSVVVSSGSCGRSRGQRTRRNHKGRSTKQNTRRKIISNKKLDLPPLPRASFCGEMTSMFAVPAPGWLIRGEVLRVCCPSHGRDSPRRSLLCPSPQPNYVLPLKGREGKGVLCCHQAREGAPRRPPGGRVSLLLRVPGGGLPRPHQDKSKKLTTSPHCLLALNLMFEFQTFFIPKIFAKSKHLATSPCTGSSVLYGDVVIFAMRRLSRGKKG